MSWVLHEEMQKKTRTSGAKNGAINCVFPLKIAPKKTHDLKHHLEHEHDGFRHFFYANPEVGASKKKCDTERRKAHILKL